MTFRTFRTGVDFHGTVVDYLEQKRLLSRRFLGGELKPFWLKSSLIELFGIRKTSYEYLLEQAFEEWDHFRHAPEIRHAIKTILLLQEQHELFLVTASGPKAYQNAINWCDKNKIFQPATERIHRVERRSPKTTIARELDLDMFIENDLDQLIGLPECVRYRLLLTDVHNEHCTLPPGIRRVNSWTEIHTTILELQGSERQSQPLFRSL